jgi:hypothetical protein
MGADTPEQERLPYAICEAMRAETRTRQTWMMHSLLRSPGTSPSLWDDHYAHIRDTHESYLVLLTPGFADAMRGVSETRVCDLAQSVSRSARAFNKRTIVLLLGIPPQCPPEVATHIKTTNDLLRAAVSDDLRICDLTSIAYEPWSATGSRPADMSEAGRAIALTIMQNHTATDAWRAIHGTER